MFFSKHDERDSFHRRDGARGDRIEGGYRALVREEGVHLLFIGSYSCTRHQGIERLELQREGKLSFLCLQEIDWITGDYMTQIEAAALEVTRLYPIKKLILFGGCQLETMSVDFAQLTKRISARTGIPLEFHKGCHLVGYGQKGESRQ